MIWKNRQFGALEYESHHVVTFPDGLAGFEHSIRFLLVNDETSQPFLWLVSLEDPDLCFPMIDPTILMPDYAVADAKNTTVLNMVSLRTPVEDSTVNMRSPILVEHEQQIGRQIVLENDRLPFRRPLFAAGEPVKG